MSYICYIISVSDLVCGNVVIKYIIYILGFVIYINLYTEINSLIIDCIHNVLHPYTHIIELYANICLHKE